MATNFNSNVQSIEQEIAQLRANGQRSYSRGNDTRLQDAINRLNMANAQGANASAAGAAGSKEARMKGEFDSIMGLTEGRGKDILNDPHTAAALKFLGGVTSGQDAPFNATVRGNMLTSASSGAAAAESSQAQQLREQMAMNGGSMTDPSAMAAMRELNSRRQGQVMDAANSIDTQANVQNFNARMQGANQLAGVRGAQNSQANQMFSSAADYRSRQRDRDEEPAFQGTPAGFNPLYDQRQGQQQQSGQEGQQTASAPLQGPRLPPRRTNLAGLPAQVRTAPSRIATPGYRATGNVGGAIQVNRGVQQGQGSGYVQMAGQPNTRVNITPQQQAQALLARRPQFDPRALGPGAF